MADFDPDAYLASSTGGFDPDAYLSASQVSAQPAQPISDDIVQRGALLPLGRTQGGELGFATPQVLIDAYQSMQRAGQPNASPEAITEAALNVGMGATRPVVGGTVARQVMPKTLTRQQVKQAPTAQELKAQGSNLFSKAKGSSAIISPESFGNRLLNIEDDLFNKGFDPNLHPKVSAAFNAMSKRMGADMDMQELQTVRRLAQNAASSPDPDEARLGSRMVGSIDDYVDNLGSKDLISGDVSGAADDLGKARQLWSQMRKTQVIDDIFQKAQNQASGLENGLRIGFRSLLNDKKRIRGFSEQEKAAMRDVVEGNFTRNTLKRLGKLGPGSGQQTNVLGAMGGAGGGALLGGPVGMIGVPAVGYVSQKAGEQGTIRAGQLARALAAGVRPEAKTVYSGAQTAPRAAMGPLAMQLQQQATPLTQEEIEFMRRGGI